VAAAAFGVAGRVATTSGNVERMKLRTLILGALALGVIGVAVSATPVVPGATAPPNPATIELALGDAQQVVVVTSSSWTTTTATAALFERTGDGSWRQLGQTMTTRIGRSGFNADHREGDGSTPAGSFGIISAFGREPDPGMALPYRQTQPGDCWISDVNSVAYNRWVSAATCSAPNEDLYTTGIGAYRYALITDYNQAATKGVGSAIFLHRNSYAADGTSRATSGCASFSEGDLLTMMRWLDRAKHPRVLIGPASWLTAPK